MTLRLIHLRVSFFVQTASTPAESFALCIAMLHLKCYMPVLPNNFCMLFSVPIFILNMLLCAAKMASTIQLKHNMNK